MQELSNPVERSKIKIVGVGGTGCGIVTRLMRGPHLGVELIAVDTDWTRVRQSVAHRKVELDGGVTRGLGSGGAIDMARRAAAACAAQLQEAIAGARLVVIVAAMGGGTGSGVAPLIADMAREAGAAALALVSLPVGFEGRRRGRLARAAFLDLHAHAGGLICMPLQALLQTVDPKRTTLLQFFATADEVLCDILDALVQLIVGPGVLCVDRPAILSALAASQVWTLGAGRAGGEHAPAAATRLAMTSPLLGVPLGAASTVLALVRCDPEAGFREGLKSGELLSAALQPGATFHFDLVIDGAKLRTATSVLFVSVPEQMVEDKILAELPATEPEPALSWLLPHRTHAP